MTEVTPLEIAHALRSAAAFCRDPNSPKCHGHYTMRADHRSTYLGSGEETRWCAVGWMYRSLGLGSGSLIDIPGEGRISTRFDMGQYEAAAEIADQLAAEIEAGIPTQQPAEQREQVTA